MHHQEQQPPPQVKPAIPLWRRLQLRILLPGLLLFFGVGLITFQSLFFSRLDTQRAIDATLARCERTGERITRLSRHFLEREDMKPIRTELKYADAEDGVDLVMLLDHSFTIAASIDETLTGQSAERHVTTEVLAAARQTRDSGERTIAINRNRSAVIGVFPIDDLSAAPPHLLLLQFDLRNPLRDATHTATLHVLISSAVLLGACSVLWLVLNQVITKRVTRVLNEARALSSGPPTTQPLGGSDELAQIDKALRESHTVIIDQAAGLRAREERHRLMVESLPAMVFVARDGKIEFMNSTGLKMLGYAALDDVRGKSPFDFISPSCHDAIRERVREVLETKTSAPPAEEEIIRCDGSTLPVETVASAFVDERGPAIQVVMHDIAERKAAEARREALGREISNASEREQRRIGQDLHDDICQRLAAVKMNMQDLEESLAEHAPALMDEADAIVDRLTDAIQITRGLARGLSPVDIEAGGLGVALTGLVRSAREMLGIECVLDIPDDLPPLPPHAATQFYRIAQECINNAAKHGRAQLVTVSLTERASRLVLRVSNDGHSFDPHSTQSQGMGLHIMRHRAESMGAELEFETKPADASVAVRCSLPLHAITHPAQS